MKTPTYDDIVASLRASNLEGLAALPGKAFVCALSRGGNHPLLALVDPDAREPAKSIALETDRCLRAIESWTKTEDAAPLLSWLNGKKGELGKDAINASGALAELRAFGTLLSTLYAITYVPVRPVPASKDRSPDFALRDNETYVEVCCLRHNDQEAFRVGERERLEPRLIERSREAAQQVLAQHPNHSVRVDVRTTLESGEYVDVSTSADLLPNGRVLTLAVSIFEPRPEGPEKKEGRIHTIASRIGGKKRAGQIPEGKPGVLWMDCCDPSWALSKREADPVNVMWQGMNLATTYGLWHAFYGRMGEAVMMAAGPVGLELGEKFGHASHQQFPGRFLTEEGRAWSAAVLKFRDGLVIFENPYANVPLPFSILRGITALRGYCPLRSLHRYANDFEGLRLRVKQTEDMLRYMAFGNSAKRAPMPDTGAQTEE